MPKTALDGLILLDLGTVINGPLGCALIGELGARVIRIEALNGDWEGKAFKVFQSREPWPDPKESVLI